MLFEGSGDTELYDDATTSEDAVLEVLAELKPDRSIRTNVEFYTALVLHGVGMETDLFSPTFAVGRVGGWTAHILEQIAEARLMRPRAAYSGELDRVWVPVEARGMAAVEQVKRAKELSKYSILSKPNVVGVGYGYKDKGGQHTDELCVVALVRVKLPKSSLKADELIPATFDGVSTDVVQVGIFGRFRNERIAGGPLPEE